MNSLTSRRAWLARTWPWLAAIASSLGGVPAAHAATQLRASSPAVPDDWHARMWTVFKEALEAGPAGDLQVQIHLNASLFKQGTEPAAMARGNLDLATVSAFDIAKVVPEFSIFTAGYVVRDPAHQQKIFEGSMGAEMFQKVSDKMDITVLATLYLGTRQLNLREPRQVRTPTDLKGVKLRMPGTKEWLFLGQALGATATPLAFGEVYLGLKTGTIDAQDNPLPTVRAAKFHEVTQQLVLTGHLVDGLFLAVSNKVWKSLTPAQQQRMRQAAQAAARYNNENRLKEESQLVDYFRQQGLQIQTPDVGAFRAAVQQAYLQSEYARVWPSGLLERINALR